MSLWDRLMGEFIDVIEWTTDDGDTMVWRFERHGNEIKNGAKLTVREGQAAVFVSEGRVADVFGPGMYELKTANLPILSTILHWDHGFQSPFKAEVYFISMKRFTDLKWGTKNPIMLRDPEFGPTRIRAFGSYSIRVTEPAVFLTEIVGTDGEFTTDEVTNELRNIIVARFSNAVASASVPVLDLAANYDDLGDFVRARIAPEMAQYGLEVSKLLVENISLPAEVEKALDRRTQMGVVGDLSKYAQFQAVESMRAAAENPGGGASEGIGIGAGLAMGQQMANAFGGATAGAPAAPASPPPLPAAEWHVAVNNVASGPLGLDALRGLVANGSLTRDTLVWRTGLAGWARAGDQAELSGLFGGQTPPPLPL